MGNRLLGARLKDLRTQAGYTQQDITTLLGYRNKSTIASWESGKSEPDAVTFMILCRLYHVPGMEEAAAFMGINWSPDSGENGLPPAPGGGDAAELRRLLSRLNADGRQKLLEHARDLMDIPRYQNME